MPWSARKCSKDEHVQSELELGLAGGVEVQDGHLKFMPASRELPRNRFKPATQT